MYYDYFQNVPYKYDDVLKRGYAINPVLTSLQEIILIYLKELSYYILKLKEMGAENNIIKEHIIDAVSGIISNIDYNRDEMQKLVIFLHQDLSSSKGLYADLCTKKNMKPEFLKTPFKHVKTFDFTEIIKRGEQHHITRNSSYSPEKKSLLDIMIFLIKNICLKIIQIQAYKKNNDDAYNTILALLNSMNLEDEQINEMKSLLEDGITEYNSLIYKLSDIQEEFYGKRSAVHIPFAPRNGKAILVSGIDLTKLEAVLDATKGKKIDVYTHGLKMLTAHTLEKFEAYENLVGHYGKGIENSLFDFASFPGSVLMSSYLLQKVEHLYKGKIFTTDKYAPAGVIKIANNDFSPLIKAALEAKGFTKSQQQIIRQVGFRQKELEEQMGGIIEKIKSDKIRHLYFIGILNQENEYKSYFEEFISLMPKDCYAISLSHDGNEENVLYIDSLCDYLFIYKMLDCIIKIKALSEINSSIFITKCDQYTITNIMNFKRMGIKNIFLCDCLPMLVNPSIRQTLKELFGVNDFSTPPKDIEITLSNKN